MSYSIDVDVEEYDVLDSMTRQEILDYLDLELTDLVGTEPPKHIARLMRLDLTLPDLIELDRWMATKRELPLERRVGTLTAPPASAEASGQAQLSPGP